jgi:hypothetical protein
VIVLLSATADTHCSLTTREIGIDRVYPIHFFLVLRSSPSI